MNPEKVSKSQVLRMWEQKWGSLTPELRAEFLNRQTLTRIVEFEKHQISFCINIHQRLTKVLAELQTRYKSSKSNNKAKGKPPPKIGKDAKPRCKFCYKLIDWGSVCEECSIEKELDPINNNAGDFQEVISSESTGNLKPAWPTEPIFESHNTQLICSNCESWIDDQGYCECKPRPTWR